MAKLKLEPKWLTPPEKSPNRHERRKYMKKVREKLGSRVWHERVALSALAAQMEKHKKDA